MELAITLARCGSSAVANAPLDFGRINELYMRSTADPLNWASSVRTDGSKPKSLRASSSLSWRAALPTANFASASGCAVDLDRYWGTSPLLWESSSRTSDPHRAGARLRWWARWWAPLLPLSRGMNASTVLVEPHATKTAQHSTQKHRVAAQHVLILAGGAQKMKYEMRASGTYVRCTYVYVLRYIHPHWVPW